MTVTVKERRLNKPEHIRALMQEQINLLRLDKDLNPAERARTIGYLSNIFLTAHRDCEAMQRLDAMEKMLRESGVIQ